MGNPYQGDDEDPFSGARDDEGNIKRNLSFGSAFREARRRGDKKFTWKGKSYTTELAKPKAKAAPKVDTRAEDEMTDTERRAEVAKKAMNEYQSQEGRFGSFKKGGTVKESSMMKKEGRGMAKADMQKVAAKAVKRHEKTMHGMKAGGSVSKRADGCAIKGKTRGKMV